MNEEQLRGLVRDSIARHLGRAPAPAAPAVRPAVPRHISLGRFVLAGDPDGCCLIEPHVMCTHCGYCESYGH